MYCWRESKLIQSLNNIVSQYLLRLNTHILYPGSYSPGYTSSQNKCICPSKSMNRNVHNRFIHNSKIMGIVQMYINRIIGELRYIHTVDYYIKIKKYIFLLHITIRLDLLTQNVAWSCQTQRVLIVSFHYEKFKICDDRRKNSIYLCQVFTIWGRKGACWPATNFLYFGICSYTCVYICVYVYTYIVCVYIGYL